MSISSVGPGSSQQYQSLTFASADTDQSDSLSLDEFSAIGQNLPAGNGGPDSAGIQKLFSAIDTDGDGQISKAEGKTAFDKLSTAMQGRLLDAQEKSGASAPAGADAPAAHRHHGHHAKAADKDGQPVDPLQSLLDSISEDDSGAATAIPAPSSDESKASSDTDPNSLFAQAVAAYTGPSSTPDVLDQLLATLQTA
jgi:hypothetical protein